MGKHTAAVVDGDSPLVGHEYVSVIDPKGGLIQANICVARCSIQTDVDVFSYAAETRRFTGISPEFSTLFAKLSRNCCLLDVCRPCSFVFLNTLTSH